MDLERLLKNAGIQKDAIDSENLTEQENISNEINELENEDSEVSILQLEMHDGSIVGFDPEIEVYYDMQYDVQLSEDDSRIALYNLERSFEKFKEEAAGVGKLTRQNTTADVKKGTLKKMAKGYGFNITDGGIPPTVSKDSWKK